MTKVRTLAETTARIYKAKEKTYTSKHADILIENGAAYRCFCTKERLAEQRKLAESKGQTYTYDKHCLHLTQEQIQQKLDAGEPYVIRQNIPQRTERRHTAMQCSGT